MAGNFNVGVVDEFIQIAHNAALAGFSALSISARVNQTTNSTTSGGRIFNKADGSTSDDYSLTHQGTTPKIAGRITTDISNTANGLISLTNGIWFYHGMSWVQSGDIKLFVDGVADVTKSTTNAMNDAGEALSIGGHSASTDRRFKGFIDDVRLYDRVLSIEEFKHIEGCRGTDGIVDGLIARWKMNEKRGGQVMSGAGSIIDIAGGFDGTPNGASPEYADSELKFRRRAA